MGFNILIITEFNATLCTGIFTGALVAPLGNLIYIFTIRVQNSLQMLHHISEGVNASYFFNNGSMKALNRSK